MEYISHDYNSDSDDENVIDVYDSDIENSESEEFTPFQLAVHKWMDSIPLFELDGILESILTPHPIMADVDPQPSYKHILLQGAVQSGKTAALLACSFMRLMKFPNSVVIIVSRNMLNDQHQMYERAELFKTQFENIITPHEFRVDIKLASDRDLDNVFRNKLRIYPTIIIALANKTQLTKVQKAIGNCKPEDDRYIMCVDEADARYMCGADALIKPLYASLVDKASLCINVTATSNELIFKEKQLLTSKVFTLPITQEYKGLDVIAKCKLLNACIPTRRQTIFESDTGFEPFLKEYITRPHIVVDGFQHPNILLCNGPKEVKHHEDILLKMSLICVDRQGVAALTFNNKGICIWNSDSKLIKINNKKGTKSEIVNHARVYKCDISDALEVLASEYRAIVIVSHSIAGRGISFVNKCEPGVNAPPKYHLTDMWYREQKNADTTQLVQSIGRLCGNQRDSIRPNLYATASVISDVEKAIHIQNKILREAKESQNAIPLPTFYKQVEIEISRMPERPLSNKTKYKLKLVSELHNNEDQYSLIKPVSDILSAKYELLVSALKTLPNTWMERCKLRKTISNMTNSEFDNRYFHRLHGVYDSNLEI
jgi:hypothetical protein